MTALEKAQAAIAANPNAPQNMALLLAAIEEVAKPKKKVK